MNESVMEIMNVRSIMMSYMDIYLLKIFLKKKRKEGGVVPYKRYGMYVVMYNMYPNRYKSRDSDIRLILNTDSRALMRSSY